MATAQREQEVHRVVVVVKQKQPGAVTLSLGKHARLPSGARLRRHAYLGLAAGERLRETHDEFCFQAPKIARPAFQERHGAEAYTGYRRSAVPVILPRLMSQELLPCVRVEPSGEARSAVVWLHGLGADGHDFEPVVPMLGVDPRLGTRFVFPHAPAIPVTINGGMVMPAWYDIVGLDLDQRGDASGIRVSAARVRDLIAHEEAHGIPANRIVLAGFSQGGAIALYLGARFPRRLAGIMGLSTYLVLDHAADEERTEANADTPAFIAHGHHDPMVPVLGGRLARDRLIELGHDVEWHEYPMEHEVCPEELTHIGVWLNRVLAAKDPD